MRLAEILHERKQTQRDLAAGIGMTEANVNLIINGKITPRLDTAQKIAQFLGLTIEEIFDVPIDKK